MDRAAVQGPGGCGGPEETSTWPGVGEGFLQDVSPEPSAKATLAGTRQAGGSELRPEHRQSAAAPGAGTESVSLGAEVSSAREKPLVEWMGGNVTGSYRRLLSPRATRPDLPREKTAGDSSGWKHFEGGRALTPHHAPSSALGSCFGTSTLPGAPLLPALEKPFLAFESQPKTPCGAQPLAGVDGRAWPLLSDANPTPSERQPSWVRSQGSNPSGASASDPRCP